MLNTGQVRPTKVDDYGSNWTPPQGSNVWHLPGFVEGGVTYESHAFWVEFDQWRGEDVWKEHNRPDAVIWSRNGAGVSKIAVRCMFARPLRDMWRAGGMEQPAFMLCWGVFELARDSAGQASRDTRATIYHDFVNGRLKKRKVPNRNGCKVWVETSGGWKDCEATIAFDGEAT